MGGTKSRGFFGLLLTLLASLLFHLICLGLSFGSVDGVFRSLRPRLDRPTTFSTRSICRFLSLAIGFPPFFALRTCRIALPGSLRRRNILTRLDRPRISSWIASIPLLHLFTLILFPLAGTGRIGALMSLIRLTCGGLVGLAARSTRWTRKYASPRCPRSRRPYSISCSG